MKNKMLDYMNLVKSFMRKHTLLFVSVKVLKLLVVLFFFSCEGKPESSKTPDTIKVDTINGNAPGDSVIYKNEEEDDDKEEENNNPLVPQES